MSTAVAVNPPLNVRPPTQNEIMKLLRERQPGLAIYNPSAGWLRPQVHGIERFLPPDLGGAIEPHPTTGIPTKCNGIYEIKGRFLTQKDSSGKTIEGQDSQSVVAYMIQRNKLGEMGVRWLPGRSKEENDAIKADGRDQWLKYQELKDEEILARRREFKSNWEKNPARQGTPVPSPTPAENDASDRLQEREHKQAYRYECNVSECAGYGTDEWTKYVAHMSAGHSIMATRSVKGDQITLTNSAGDKTVIGAMGGTDGKPIESPSEESLEAAAAAQGSLDDVHPALKGLSTAKAAVKRGKKKGG